MNAYLLRSFLVLGIAASLAACDKDDQCIADCNGLVEGSTGGDSESASSTSVGGSATSTSSGTSESTTGEPVAACAELTEEATQFLVDNRACETLLDCTSVDGICYHGELEGPCGSVGVSANVDRDAWNEIASGLEQSCECGANACGSTLMCNAEFQCEAVFFSEDFCPNVARDVQTFLDANRACDTDADCVVVDSVCYVDDCYGVALNAAAAAEDWQSFDQILQDCEAEQPGGYCNVVGDCSFTAVCNAQGQCERSL